MVKLPTRENLGGLPPARTGRTIARYKTSVPDLATGQEIVSRGIEMGARGLEVGARGIDQAARARGAAGMAIAEGLQDLGRGFGKVSDDFQGMRDKDDALDVMRADADLKLRRAQRINSLINNDPDYRSWAAKDSEASATEIEETVSSVKNPELAEKLRIQATLDAGLDNERLKSEATKRDRVAKLADFKLTHEKHATRYAMAKTDAERQHVSAQAKIDRDLAIAAGIIDDVEALQFVEDFDKLTVVDAKEHIQRDPQGYLDEESKRGGAALHTIREAEGTTDADARRYGFESGYDLPLGYGAYGVPPKPLTEMTLEEVYKFGRQVLAHPDNPHNSSAMGAYQIVGNTLVDVMSEAGLSWGDKFTPENQDKLARVIIAKQGFGAWEGFKNYPELLPKAEIALEMPSGRYADLPAIERVKLRIEANELLNKPGSVHEARRRFAKPTPLNPLDGDEKKRVSAVAADEGWVEGIMGKDQEIVDSNVVPFIQQWGILPEEVKGSIEGLLRSPDPASVTFAMSTMDALEKASPRAFKAGTNDEMTELLARYRVSGQYQKPEEFAAEIIEERSNTAKAAAHKVASEDGKKRAEKIAPYLAGYFNEGPLSGYAGGRDKIPREALAMLPGTPGVPEDPAEWELAQQEFIPLYAAAWEKYGSHDKAMPVAMDVFKRTWFISNVTGTPRIMKFAPEMFNPEGLDAKWQEYQARARLYPLIGDGPFTLTSDARTELEIQAGKYPTWLVSVPVPAPITRTATDEGYKVVKMKASAAGGSK